MRRAEKPAPVSGCAPPSANSAVSSELNDHLTLKEESP